MTASERDLIERAKREPEAFGMIFDMHYDRIFSYVLRRTGNADVAVDIVSETFMKALRGLDSFVWKGIPIVAWLYRIAGNEVKMHYRKGIHASASLSHLMEEGFDREDTSLVEEQEMIDEALSREEDLARLRIAIQSLPELYQEAVTLRHVEGKSSAEVAEILGKNEGTTRSLISRGLSMLREALGDTPQRGDNEGIVESESDRVLVGKSKNR